MTVPVPFEPPIRAALRFLAQWVVAGLAGAFIILWLFPGVGRDGQPGDPRGAGEPPAVRSYHDAVAAVAPAVVNVYAIRVQQVASNPVFQDPLFKRFFGEVPGREKVDRVFGSGVIVDPSGLVITNNHLVRGADEVRVTLADGRQSSAELVGSDPETELALIRLLNVDRLTAAPIGDSERLRVGDVVLAIGNPYDFGQTVTQGIVSATGRTSLGITTFEDFIQTDADINPGNSGGALINADGQLVGINTANYTETGGGGSQGIGFAIPVNLTMNIVHELLRSGTVERGWLGIEAQALSPSDQETIGLKHGGVLVAWVLQGSPAAAAGLRPGDVITGIEGRPVNGPRQAIQMIAGFRPGTEISLELLRGWNEIRIRATVGRRAGEKRS